MASVSTTQIPETAPRRVSAFLFRHPRVKLGATIGAPLLWMVVIYLSALAFLFVSSLWRLDPLSGLVVHDWGLQNFKTIFTEPVFRQTALRTVMIAAGVTVADVVLAFPLGYYAGRMATPRVRSALLLAIVVPLWSSYLVRAFAWKIILTPNGILNWVTEKLGFSVQLGSSKWSVALTFTYLWLPFVTLPIYAALERIPGSLLEASSDLGGRGWITFRRVVLPLALPGIVAGSIFSFSLTLGDYIVPTLVGNTYFIGNLVYSTGLGVANNLPLAAAYALVPVAVMGAYLFIAKRLGAFEAL
jgi:putative spermidine/putrescine transport system permease protein